MWTAQEALDSPKVVRDARPEDEGLGIIGLEDIAETMLRDAIPQ